MLLIGHTSSFIVGGEIEREETMLEEAQGPLGSKRP